MRILLIAQFGQTGGTREILKKILSIHQSAKIETHVILLSNSIDNNLKTFIHEKGASYSECNKKSGFFLKSIHNFFQLGELIKKWNPDLIVSSIANPIQALTPFFQNYPRLYILHSIPKETSLKLKPIYKMLSLTSGRSKFICSVSNAAVDSIYRNWGYDKNRLVVLHNSFNPENVGVTGGKMDQTGPVVLTLGHMHSYKNPEVWLLVAKKVVQKHESVKFLWLGNGPLKTEYQKKTETEKRIHFLGHQEDVKSFYSKASIYFQPSKKENHSLSVIDAMANGLPCIVSNIGGQPESVQDGVNGFLHSPHHTEGFAESILKLLNNSALRKKLGEQSRIIANEKFHPDNYKTNLKNLYRKVANTG